MEWNIPEGNSVCARERESDKETEDKKKSESFPQRVIKSSKNLSKQGTHELYKYFWIPMNSHLGVHKSLSCLFRKVGVFAAAENFENKFASPCKVTKVDKI